MSDASEADSGGSDAPESPQVDSTDDSTVASGGVDSAGLDTTWACLVNWNGGPRNTTCVASLLAQGLAPQHIVLVDNGSADGSAEAAVRAYPGVALIENGINTGWALGLDLLTASPAPVIWYPQSSQATLTWDPGAYLPGDEIE